MRKRLGSWKFKLLSFTGRWVTIQHVIRAMPVHIIACLSLQKRTLDQMETLSRQFLWGENPEGNPKVPLVAWDKIQKPKRHGGLGITEFRELSKATRMKHVAKFFTHPDEEWVETAEQLIRSVNSRGREDRERSTWSFQDLLILKPPVRVHAAPTISGLLDCWNKARLKLHIDKPTRLDSELKPSMFLYLAHQQNWISLTVLRQEQKTLKQLSINSLKEWKPEAQRFLDRNPHVTTTVTPEAAQHDTLKVLASSFSTDETTKRQVHEREWYWQPRSKRFTGWTQTTATWKAVLREAFSTTEVLNRKWDWQDPTRKWAKRLSKIWKAPLPHKDKIWAWKMIQHGLPTLDRVEKWDHGDGICCRCKNSKESIEHLFIDRTDSQKKWHDWQSKTSGSKLRWRQTRNLIDMFDEAWRNQNWGQACALIKVTWSMWLDRNARTYSSQARDTRSKLL
ncbi:hypothetical protein R1sor_006094 [Riccia sorocarpa]|uniref:Reverse transcriptase zinc-binding domain-containing protein n=1 Tax=Riccia sorocarpa TaxID=122646 RepID=A0ABD3HM19_9MARC